VKGRKARGRAQSGGLGGLPRRRRLSWLAALALAGLGLLSLLESTVWVGALLAELRLWLALVALGAAIVITLMGERLAGAATLLVALAAALPFAPLYRATKPTPQAGPLLHVAHLHAAGAALSTDELGRWLSGLGTVEVAVITGAAGVERWPRRIAGFEVQTGATAALFVGAGAKDVRFPTDLKELRSVSLAVGHCRVRVVAIDLPSRFDRLATVKRAQKLAALENVTPIVRSVYLGPLLAKQELRDSRRSHGILGTAPAALGTLGLPLDHVLVHGWVGVRERSVEIGATPDTHRTVRATLELTEPRCRL
jgi:hypothetical protein